MARDNVRTVVGTQNRRDMVARSTSKVMVTRNGGVNVEIGNGSGTVPAIAFAYGDATPTTIYVVAQNGVLTQSSIAIDTPFNGAGATLKLSVGATTILDTTQNNPAQVAEYQTAPTLAVTTGTAVVLTIVPGAGATAGNGRIFLEFT